MEAIRVETPMMQKIANIPVSTRNFHSKSRKLPCSMSVTQSMEFFKSKNNGTSTTKT